MTKKGKKSIQKKTIGWREKASLPDLGITSIRLKVDSGAKTSALHATRVEFIDVGKKKKVKFRVHPRHNDSEVWVTTIADFVEKRWVKSSTGVRTLRPVIKTTIVMAGETFPIEVTLVNREMMGFRMLLGREAFGKRFLVDASKSFLGTKAKGGKK